MSTDVQARAVEPFFTTKTGTGTGLGLSMVHKFVKQSGGHLSIDSRPGFGTTVYMYLPRGRAIPEPAQQPPAPVHQGRETILVVEDDPHVRFVVVQLLRTAGYTVFEATDADSALTLLSGLLQVDLLFTDILMPGHTNGFDLAQRAEALRPELKVLFTSGHLAESPERDREVPAGTHLLQKPYRGSALREAVRLALDSRPHGR